MLKSEKNGYRGLQYSIRRLEDDGYEWKVYPKKEDGSSFTGHVDGDEGEAVAACKAAIDRWLETKSN